MATVVELEAETAVLPAVIAGIRSGGPVRHRTAYRCGMGAIDEATGAGTLDTSAADPPVACTLDAHDVATRVAEWQEALALVVPREQIDGGVRLVLPAGSAVGGIAELARAEQACCGFLRFALTLDARGAALEVRACDEAAEIVHSLFGEPA